MAQEIQHFTVTIPAGTPIATPVTVAIPTGVRVVRQVDWRVPAGPAGTLGWQIAMGGVKVLPLGTDKYVVANNEHGSWPLHDAPDSGAWQVIGYNTGVNPHSVYLVFHCDPVIRAPVRRPLLLAADLMPSPDLSQAGPPVMGRP